MVEQVKLRFGECPFPGCHRPSRPGYRAKKRKKRTDPAGTGRGSRSTGRTWTTARSGPRGKTTSSNLFPPCRGHHRLKTFTDWTYDYDPPPVHLDQPARLHLTPTPARAETRAARRHTG